MASIHQLALSHLAVAAVGLVLIVTLLRRITRRQAPQIRAAYPQSRRRPRPSPLRLGGRLWRATLRFGVALASPIGLLCANRRYPAVAPVLAAFERQMEARGHGLGRARCFPLLFATFWLVRCPGCRQRGLFREVPTPDGLSVALKVLDQSLGKARACTAEYLLAPPLPSAQPTRAWRVIRRRGRSSSHTTTTDRTA